MTTEPATRIIHAMDEVPPERRSGESVDSVRFEVAPVLEPFHGFQVLVFVDDVEVTSLGAGLGMDPYDVFVPHHRLTASDEPRRVPIARCTCGDYGCSWTDVAIVRDGDRVHWEWHGEQPMERGAAFPAAEYDAAVEHLGSSFGWETPERTAGRLVLRDVDRDRLRSLGLEPDWAGNDHGDPPSFRVAFRVGEDYQVFVRFPWNDRTPQELAAEVQRTLAQAPRQWPATWHAIRRDLEGPPPMVGRNWRLERW